MATAAAEIAGFNLSPGTQHPGGLQSRHVYMQTDAATLTMLQGSQALVMINKGHVHVVQTALPSPHHYHHLLIFSL